MTYYLLLACLVLWISTLFSHRTSFSLYIALFRYPSHICTPLIITMVSVISCNIFPARLFQYPHFIICCLGFVILYCVYYVFWFIQKLVDVILCLALFCKSISDITKPATRLPFRFEH